MRRSTAFTLLEVLAGIAILGLAATVLGAAYVNTVQAHAAVARRAATGSGLEYLRAAVLGEPEREKVEQGGRLPLPGELGLTWETTVEEAAVPDLFRVHLRGRMTDAVGDTVEEFSVTLMLWRPGWTEPGRRERWQAEWGRLRKESQP